jgi:hypothetical protein
MFFSFYFPFLPTFSALPQNLWGLGFPLHSMA